MANRYKNGLLSAGFGTLQQLLTLTFGLIVPRLFIQTFGSEVNGLLTSIGNIYGYLALVEAGVGTVAIQALYGPLGRGDKKSINEIMTATANYYNKAGFIYLSGVILLSVIYPLAVVSSVPRLTIWLLIVLSGIGGVVNFWVQGKYMVLLQAEGKKYLMSIVGMLSYVTQNFMKIYLLVKGFDVIAIHVGYCIIGFAQMIFYYFYMKKHYTWLNLKDTPNKKALAQSNAVFVQEITRMICSNTDIVVLTFVAKDLKSVSVYNVYMMVYSTIEKLFSTFFGSFHYVLGQKYNTDKSGYMPMHKTYEVVSMIGSFALYTIAFVLTTPFMKIYTAGITDIKYVDSYLPFLFTFMHLLSSSREASSRVINFAGHFKQMQWRSILEASINLCVSVVLVKIIGIYGVLFGTIIAYFYRTNDIIIYANRKILKRKCWETYRIWLTSFALYSMIALAFTKIPVNPSSFVEFFGIAVPIGTCICACYLFEAWILDKEAAKQLWGIVVRILDQFIPAKK